MAISGVTDIHITGESVPDPALTDFINNNYGDKLIASYDADTTNHILYLNIQDKASGIRFMQLKIYERSTGIYTKIFTYNNNAFESIGSADPGYWSIYGCTNGLLIRAQKGDKSTETWAFITFNSDDNIIYGCSKVAAAGASPESFTTTVWDSNILTTTVSNVQAGSTSLFNLVYNGPYGATTIAEKAYYAIYAQYPRAIGVLNINDNYYLSCGWFVIAD